MRSCGGRRSGRAAALSGQIPTKGKNQDIVKIFSAQPPQRIASFETSGALLEKNAKMEQVDK